MLGSAIRVSTPFPFVSLGEVVTDRSGRINLGVEGTLDFGAMAGHAVAYLTASAWAGVLAAALAGAAFGLIHDLLCSLLKANDIAIGIALMPLGTGLAIFFGKPFIQPVAPDLPTIGLGWWSDLPQVHAALRVNVLFLIGVAPAFAPAWMFRKTRINLTSCVVGDSSDAARALGMRPATVHILATAFGGALAGIGGAYLSLFHPGSRSEGISSGQGLIAVALMVVTRWSPVNCFFAALLFGAAGALGSALQSVGVASGYHRFYASPFVLTLAVLIMSSSKTGALTGAPREPSITK